MLIIMSDNTKQVYNEITTNSKYIYIVTCYGCNSTPSDLWTPYSKIFNDYVTAYEYFLSESPALDDDTNAVAEKWYNEKHDEIKDQDYVVIENRRQLSDCDDDDKGCAKRPKGTVIAKIKRI